MQRRQFFANGGDFTRNSATGDKIKGAGFVWICQE